MQNLHQVGVEILQLSSFETCTFGEWDHSITIQATNGHIRNMDSSLGVVLECSERLQIHIEDIAKFHPISLLVHMI